MDPVKFVPFSSTVDSPFWVEYCHLKLEDIQLSEDAISMQAQVQPISSSNVARLQCLGGGSNSLTHSVRKLTPTAVQRSSVDKMIFQGNLVGFNTLETFSKVDKNKLLKEHFLKGFLSSEEANDEQILKSLTSFILLTFPDLKQHKVLYWFGIPALMSKTKLQAKRLPSFSSEEQLVLEQAFHSFRREQESNQLPTFFVFSNQDPSDIVIHPLSKDSFSKLSKDHDGSAEQLVFGFVDSTTVTTDTTQQVVPPMGWPLRNLLAYLSIHLNLGGSTISILSFRPNRLHRLVDETIPSVNSSSNNHIQLQMAVPNKEDYSFEQNNTSDNNNPYDKYKVVGWELNARGKPGPRWVNLKPLLDKNHLAIQAADLNLKLMKWRMIPNLDVTRLQSTKVLLIGAGTLGCSVARTLMGWGIRDFTILDYGTVSYSNPVRQNLFALEDCHFNNGQGKPKAQAAADALKTIAADVKSRGIHLSIPMPGHSESLESVQESVSQLDTLVQEADAIFLLTDTRESRWLPTVMAAAHDKILINAALGLDSWLVMRHGGGVGNRLGCYFCNDVVAPENSTKNRTLDQQCTVTRPGLAPIASSMAAELLVSIMHHPLKQLAPAPKTRSSAFSPTVSKGGDDEEEEVSDSSPLGVMPHQIRGSLVSYTMMTPTVPCFTHCTGCSQPLIDAYKKDKMELVFETCKSVNGSYLEQISGLEEFRAQAAAKMAEMDEMDWDVEDDGDEDF
ncbi:unnamed protein product [Cylindrotheca closterium]|uniref:Ubiquitin-like modifier-activating enzyme ATG7 n=1 Tax=Cylindrotheca closterium TaxID=2856 RepID=A0AAD2JGM0_9STRA|nr:unnamed protein product [Cylindrotheca closterium]